MAVLNTLLPVAFTAGSPKQLLRGRHSWTLLGWDACHKIDHQHNNLFTRMIVMHLMLDVVEGREVTLLRVGRELFGRIKVGDLISLRMPKTKRLFPLS